MATALAHETVLSEIRRMMASAHPEMSEPDRDHQSLILEAKVMAQALPGIVRRVNAVHPIGRHSICEFEEQRGAISRIVYASLEAL